MAERTDLHSQRSAENVNPAEPLSELAGSSLPGQSHRLDAELCVLPANIQSFAAAWGGGASNVVSEAARALVLWSPQTVPIPEIIDTAREQQLLSLAGTALDRLLAESGSYMGFTGRAMLKGALEDSQAILSTDGGMARSSVRHAFFARALKFGIQKEFVPLELSDQNDTSSYNGIEILNLRNLMFEALDNLAKRKSLEIKPDCLLSAAFPEIVELSKSDEPYVIIGSHIAAFVSSYIGNERLEGVLPPSAEHLRHGHLDNVITAYQVPAAVNFLPPDLMAKAGETVREHNAREDNAAEWVKQNFQNRLVVIDVGQAGAESGNTHCEVLCSESPETLQSYAALLKARHQPLNLPAGPYYLSGTPKHEIRLSLEVNSLESIATVKDSPHIPIGIVKTEFLLRQLTSESQEIWESAPSQLQSTYLNFLMEAGDRNVCFRLVDEGDKVSIPADQRLQFMERQIDAMVFAAETEQVNLQIMIPDMHSTEHFYSVKAALERAVQSYDVAELDFEIVPMVEGPKGRAALRELLNAGESFATVAVGLSDLSTRESGISDRGQISLRIMPDRVIRALEDVVRLAQSCGAGVRVAGNLARDTGNFALLLGVGVSDVAATPDHFNKLVEVSSKLELSHCREMAHDCKVARDVFARARILNEHFEQLQIPHDFVGAIRDDAREQSDLLDG